MQKVCQQDKSHNRLELNHGSDIPSPCGILLAGSKSPGQPKVKGREFHKGMNSRRRGSTGPSQSQPKIDLQPLTTQILPTCKIQSFSCKVLRDLISSSQHHLKVQNFILCIMSRYGQGFLEVILQFSSLRTVPFDLLTCETKKKSYWPPTSNKIVGQENTYNRYKSFYSQKKGMRVTKTKDSQQFLNPVSQKL